MCSSNKAVVLALLVVAPLSLATARAAAMGFGEVGLGTQVLVVDGDQGSQRGLGFDLRARFLWILGIDFTATSLESTEQVWMPSTYRLGLMLHPWTSEHFDCYVSPGVAGDDLGDLFNPEGGTTWFRLGGGAEVRFLDGFALGFEVHWTLPGEAPIERYIDEHGEELWEEYLMALGTTEDLPTSISEVSTADLLAFFPLDRFEFTIGARYYF